MKIKTLVISSWALMLTTFLAAGEIAIKDGDSIAFMGDSLTQLGFTQKPNGYVHLVIEGLKVGLYFSPPDWWYCRNHISFSYPDQPPVDFHHCQAVIPKPPPEFGERLVRYTRNQIEELLSNYGRIDIMFFDGCVTPALSDSHVAISMELLRELQPGMLVNPRMHGYGDYLTPESHMPETKPPGFFEFCDISDKNAWGYLNNQKREYFPTSRFIERLSQCRAWGGNFLLNFGPDPDGDLPPEAYNAIRAIGTALRQE